MTDREQAFEQWFAERYPDTTSVYSEFRSTPVRDLMREAMAAGREQGLREAAALFPQPHMEYFGSNIVDAIEQLRACGSAATPG